jgi:hypothetical protein
MNLGKSLRTLGCTLIGATMFAALPLLARAEEECATGPHSLAKDGFAATLNAMPSHKGALET